jgi:mannose-6-phosphate isomerase-like protein (cupin superfamily)
MKRSVFLQTPLVASALLANAKNSSRDRVDKGFKVDAGQDRFQEELLIMGGRFDCKVSGKDTDGDLCIYDTVRQEKGGPALHLHHNQDEWFYIIKGEFIAKIGEDLLHLKAGDSAFAPRKIPHAFAKVGDDEGQMLILFQPAGSMEDYFIQVSKLGGTIQDQAHGSGELMKTHGMEVVGPPLKY